jgi:hypothetical protein
MDAEGQPIPIRIKTNRKAGFYSLIILKLPPLNERLILVKKGNFSVCFCV